MNESITENQKNVGAIMHAATFAKYIFPLGNFVAPLVLWTIHKDKPFLDHHGKQALNFQLSILVYALGLGLLSVPFVAIFAADFVGLLDSLNGITNYHQGSSSNIAGYIILFIVFALLFFGLFLFELYYVIIGAIAASKGEYFTYPLCIKFITNNEESITTEPSTPTEESTNI